MGTSKNVRWKCETCGSGVLAPSRPRRNDARRYCLPCTETTGRLVERISPALERKRAMAKEVRQQRSRKQRDLRAAKSIGETAKKRALRDARTYGAYGYEIQKEARKAWKLLEPFHGGRAMPKVEVQMQFVRAHDDGTFSYKEHRSFASMTWNRITLSPKSEWLTLAHELVHCAVGSRYGQARRSVHDKVFYDALRDVTQRRFRTSISFAKVGRYGYEVDEIINRQLRIDPNYKAFIERCLAKKAAREMKHQEEETNNEVQ